MSRIKVKNQAIEGRHDKPIITDFIFDELKVMQPIIIFCHGYKGFKDWGAWQIMLESIAKEGYFVVAFNFSHNGGALENPIDFPDLEAFGNDNFSIQQDDLQSVIDELTKSDFNFNDYTNPKKITLIGHSRGGGAAIIKAATEPKITQLVTLASISTYDTSFPTGETLAEWKETGVWMIENQRTKQMMPHYIQFYEDYMQNKEALNIENAARKLAIPHLVIHGTADTSVNIKSAETILSCNSKAEKYFLDTNHVFGSKHPWKNQNMPEDMRKVTARIVSFLEKFKIS